MKKLTHSYLFLFGVAGILVALDQWTKYLVRTNLEIGQIWSPVEWLTPYARIVHWYNTGVVFGLFQDGNKIFMVLSAIISLVIIYYFRMVPKEEWALRLAMGFQLGGALGNLVDRIFIGHVTDFLSVGTFPVFNVADSSITVGVAILLLGVWIQEFQQKKKSTLASAPEAVLVEGEVLPTEKNEPDIEKQEREL